MKVIRRVVLEIIEEFEVPNESNLMNINKYAGCLAKRVKTEDRKVKIIRAELAKEVRWFT